MFVIKRSGSREGVKFDKITARIKKQCYGLDKRIDPIEIAKKVIQGIHDGITTEEVDILTAETAASLTPTQPDYAKLAARIAVSNLHKTTKKDFSLVVDDLRNYVNPKTNTHSPLIAEDVYDVISKNKEILDSAIIYDRDFDFDYFGFKTLEKGYLLKINGRIAERPQHMWMRVAVGIHKSDIDAVIETYNLLSQRFYTHGTPTLFNGGSIRPQLSSCYLTTVEDSIDGIMDTFKDCAMMSKYAGGIGLSLSSIRAKGSYISKTNGTSNGIVPMLRVLDMLMVYIDQGGGRRKGSCAVYLEPWHAEVFDFLDLKKNHGKEEVRARDLFYGFWIPDLFMKQVEADGDWALFCPHEAPGLQDAWGVQFEELYERYRNEGKARQIVKARELWYKVLESQIETGMPYLLYKDACNRKSNQNNRGKAIRSSNLCAEIVEYTDENEIAVCNLASLSLPKYIKDDQFDFDSLYEASYTVTKNLDKVIDINYYPVAEAEYSNKKNRPVGLGVQGLADTFLILRMPFDSAEARQLNKEIFETIYFAAMTASKDLAKTNGTYETYAGSPISQGKFQWELWNDEAKENDTGKDYTPTSRWDWSKLRKEILKHGVRNSLTTCAMPTASTSQILSNSECIEPYKSNIFLRRTLSGEFVVVNRHLVKDLTELGLWSSQMKDKIIGADGSIKDIPEIPQNLKDLYKTVWEISQKSLIDLASDRGAYIDQSQSMNLFIESPNFAKLTSMHFYAWKTARLKTGMYYLRTQGAASAVKFTVQKETKEETNYSDIACSLDSPESCVSCGS